MGNAETHDFARCRQTPSPTPRALRQTLNSKVSGALRSVGDSELAAKFDEARTVIKRDVIFAASLYL